MSPPTNNSFVFQIHVIDIAYVMAVRFVVFCYGTHRTNGQVTAFGIAVETKMLVLMPHYRTGPLVVELV